MSTTEMNMLPVGPLTPASSPPAPTSPSVSRPDPGPLLANYLIPGPPDSMYYIPSFISADEETTLMNHINAAPIPQWRQLAHRRLQSLPSPLSPQNTLLHAPLPSWLQRLTQRLNNLRVLDSGMNVDGATETPASDFVFGEAPHKGPNHCLINEYQPGQGIMAHEDGPAYYPVTATVSLNSHAVLEVRLKDDGGDDALPRDQREWRILCEPRSLLITMGDAYVTTLHAIEEIAIDGFIRGGDGGVANWNLMEQQEREAWTKDMGIRERETRVSLTFRDVRKVKRINGLGGPRKWWMQ